MILSFTTTFPRSESPDAAAWSQRDEDTIVDALKNLRVDISEQDRELLSVHVFELLQETTSQRIQNAAALKLVDLGINQTTMRIVDFLRRSDLAEVSGTLLFALNEIDASIPLDIIVDVIENGSFEARNQSMLFLEEHRFIDAEPVCIEAMIARLSKLVESKDEEQAEAAEFARFYLSEYA